MVARAAVGAGAPPGHPALARPLLCLHRLTESLGAQPVPPAVPGSVRYVFWPSHEPSLCLTVGVTRTLLSVLNTSVYISYICRCNTQPHVCIDTMCHVSYVTQVKLSPFYNCFIIFLPNYC